MLRLFVLGCFVLSVVVHVQGVGMLGGHREVTADDTASVEEAKKMIQEAVGKKLNAIRGFKTETVLSDWEVTRQTVRGILYNFKWKTTYNYKCIQDPASNDACANKESKVHSNCTASVWKKPGSSTLEFADGKAPKCE